MIRFTERDFSGLVPPLAGLSFAVQRYAFTDQGGPDTARVVVEGSPDALLQLEQLLRCGVELFSEEGALVWWGYLHEVAFEWGAVETGVTLEEMANRIKVEYSALTFGSTAATETETAWASTSESVTDYGTKERIVDMTGGIVAQAAAEQRRATELAAREFPVATVDVLGRDAIRDSDTARATLLCYGWFRTLGWQHYSQGEGRVRYFDEGDLFQAIGQAAYSSSGIDFDDDAGGDFLYDSGAGFERYLAGQVVTISGSAVANNTGTKTVLDVWEGGQGMQVAEDLDDQFGSGLTITLTPLGSKAAQSFAMGAGESWQVGRLAVRARSIGSPGDNLQIGIYSDSSGSPGSLLVSGTIAGSQVNTLVGWTSVEVSTSYTLVASTTYWIVVERTGSSDSANCYAVELSEDMEASGAYKYWDGSAWQTRSPNADMPFDVIGEAETSAMIDAIATAKGEFITDVDVEDASGVYSLLYTMDDEPALDAIKRLAALGTSNDRRLLLAVTPARRLRVYEEPASSEARYYLGADGALTDAYGAAVPAEQGLYGVWARLRGVPLTDAARRADATLVFLSGGDYDARRGEWRPRARNIPSVWEG